MPNKSAPDASATVPPSPAPESVIREFTRTERSGDSPTGWTGEPFLDVDAMAVEIARLRSTAPESVEGVVESLSTFDDPWQRVARVPDDWPIGTRVRIQRVSE